MAGTVGHKVLSRMKKIEIEKKVVWSSVHDLWNDCTDVVNCHIFIDQCPSVSAVHVI